MNERHEEAKGMRQVNARKDNNNDEFMFEIGTHDEDISILDIFKSIYKKLDPLKKKIVSLRNIVSFGFHFVKSTLCKVLTTQEKSSI